MRTQAIVQPQRALASNSGSVLKSLSANPSPPGGVLIPTEAQPWFNQQHYMLGRGKTTIGRAPDCHVRINHPNVSRVHCEMFWSGGDLMIAHKSPVNPTLVNGMPLADPRLLKSGDRIELAHGVEFRLELFAGDSDDASTEPRREGDRRMFAILHADVVSFSRLVEDNDIETARQFESCLKIIRSESERVGGRIENLAGDAILIFFTSASAAVNSAISWQRRITVLNQGLDAARRMEFRVGVNSGDVLVTPSGALTETRSTSPRGFRRWLGPGGILVAGAVRDQVQGQAELRFEFVRTNELKNISREVRLLSGGVLRPVIARASPPSRCAAACRWRPWVSRRETRFCAGP